MTSGSDRNAEAFAANEALWDAWTAVHSTGELLRPRGLQGRRRSAPPVRDRARRRCRPAGRCSTCSATSGSTRCRGPGSGRASPARTSRRPRSSWRGRSPTSSASRTRASCASNLYDLPDVLDGTFDVVYTSRGVLGWLPDIRGWARVVAHFLAPGGRFFITEIHPVAKVFENEGVAAGELRLSYPYWEHDEPLTFPVKGSYADPTADVGEQTEHGWDHGLGEIVTALIDAGLRIETLVEHPFLEWKADFLVADEDGTLAAAARRRR